ncbi:MAG: hypothetical protein PVS3B2_00230 [Candidatus Dormibacteraceae bacterium]
MSPDHAITPEIIQREMVRLTGTGDVTSRVIVVPGKDEQGVELAVITFVCEDIPAQIACLPLDLVFLSVEDFADRVLVPLADAWVTEKAWRNEQAAIAIRAFDGGAW